MPKIYDVELCRNETLPEEGVEMKVGIPLDCIEEDNWASDAVQLADALLDHEGFRVQVIDTAITENSTGRPVAVFEYFARFDTVYLHCYKGRPLTLSRAIAPEE